MLLQEAKQNTSQKMNSESEQFDSRPKIALSNGTVKAEINDGSFDLVEYDSNASFDKSREYFEYRIERERRKLKESPNNIISLLRVGDIYAANSKTDKAKNYYNRAFRLNTDNPLAIKKLVEIYLIKGDPKKASEILNFAGLSNNNGLLHVQVVVEMILQNYTKAIEVGKKIPTDAKDYFEVLNTLGIIHVSKGDVKKAKDYFLQSIKNNSNYSPAKSNLALALETLGDSKSAEVYFREAISDNPSFISAYHNLFNLFVKEERIEEAYELMKSIRHLSKPDNEIQFRIAWSLMKLSRFHEAISEYNKVLELLPDNPATLNNLGHCYASLGDIKLAYGFFKRAIKPVRGRVLEAPYRNFMILSEKVGRIEDSRRIADDLLAAFPDDADALVYRGDRYVNEEKWDKALKDLEAAYKKKPRLSTLYMNLSLIYADVYPNYEKGMEVCEFVLHHAEEIDSYQAIYNNYAHLHLVNGNTDIESLIAHLNEKHPVSLCTLALFDLLKGNEKQAIAKYKDSIELSRNTLKDRVVQRMNFDLGAYYLEKSDNLTAKGYLSDAVDKSPKGYEYVRDNAKMLLKSLDSQDRA